MSFQLHEQRMEYRTAGTKINNFWVKEYELYLKFYTKIDSK